MEQNIKYELIINKALRSAFEYDIPDDQIKELYPLSYDILTMQNVENLAVSPLRYKDQIRGFFGVDNPPKGDFKRLSEFLDMIGTLLVSLLKAEIFIY